MRPRRIGTFSQWLHRTSKWCLRTTSTPSRSSGVLVVLCSFSSCMELGTRSSALVLRGHAIRRRGCKMRAGILYLPLIAVAGGHVEKVDRYHGDGRSIRTIDIAHGKNRVNERDVRLDEADPVVGKRRLRAAVDGLLRLRAEFLHHLDPPLQKVTRRSQERSIFVE